MKCLLCPAEIDDKKEFPVEYGPGGTVKYDEAGQRAHSAELSRWNQLVVATGTFNDSVILQGHVCPEETPEVLATISLSKKGSK